MKNTISAYQENETMEIVVPYEPMNNFFKLFPPSICTTLTNYFVIKSKKELMLKHLDQRHVAAQDILSSVETLSLNGCLSESLEKSLLEIYRNLLGL